MLYMISLFIQMVLAILLLIVEPWLEVAFSFVRRSANSAAHTIARVGSSMSGLGEWSVVPPP